MSERAYPDKLEVKPLERPPVATVRVPGSKSITNRALVLAALYSPADGCELRGVLDSEDTRVMVECLRLLGYGVYRDGDATITVHRACPQVVPAGEADLFVGNSGTTMRFLTAILALGNGRYRIDGVSRMRERPIENLLDALRQLGETHEVEVDAPGVGSFHCG